MKTEILEPVIRVPFTRDELLTLRIVLQDKSLQKNYTGEMGEDLKHILKNANDEYFRGDPNYVEIGNKVYSWKEYWNILDGKLNKTEEEA